MERNPKYWHLQNGFVGYKTTVGVGTYIGILDGKMYEYGHIGLPQRIIDSGKKFGNPEVRRITTYENSAR